MNKVKVGDTVRDVLSQKLGTVTEIDSGNGSVLVDIEQTDSLKWISVNDIELVLDQTQTLNLKESKLPAPEPKEAVKHDTGKAPISLIPMVSILGMARVFGFGAKKYGRHNYRKGMDHSRVLDAAARHLIAIMDGEDTDPESGEPHWAHALCCLAMYAFFRSAGVGKDDRYRNQNSITGDKNE